MLEALTALTGSRADALNLACVCVTLDSATLAIALDREAGTSGFADALQRSHPTLFSNVAVFVDTSVLTGMAEMVQAIEVVARLPGYRAVALAHASEIAMSDLGPAGVLMGYDFHLTPEGPRLIEINTNAGGAFLNAALARAHRACSGAVDVQLSLDGPMRFETRATEMFIAEWRRQRGDGRPAHIAIVDDAPEEQLLLPEFQLAQAVLAARGFEVRIADAVDLTFDAGVLAHQGWAIDLVYNRLVDFALAEPRHAALRAAYATGAVVVTPNPHIHALLADKRNLALLSDSGRLAAWGLDPHQAALLARGVPETVVVDPDRAQALWAERKRFFFKPAAGYGGKAAYRGANITRKA